MRYALKVRPGMNRKLKKENYFPKAQRNRYPRKGVWKRPIALTSAHYAPVSQRFYDPYIDIWRYLRGLVKLHECQ